MGQERDTPQCENTEQKAAQSKNLCRHENDAVRRKDELGNRAEAVNEQKNTNNCGGHQSVSVEKYGDSKAGCTTTAKPSGAPPSAPAAAGDGCLRACPQHGRRAEVVSGAAEWLEAQHVFPAQSR